MTLHLAGGIFFAIFVKDRRRFGNLSVQIRAIALGFHYFLEQAAWRPGMKNKFVRFYAVLAFTAFS